MNQPSGLVVAIAGATGAVGREMMRMLEASELPIARVVPLASARSAGTRLSWRGSEVEVEALHEGSFAGVDLALFSAGGSRSLAFAPAAVRAGAVVIDNSSAWRMDARVPLVVPEVNGDALESHRGIIANPNCSTIQMVLPLVALDRAASLMRVVVSTYQSASGAGQAGIDELLAGTRAAMAEEAIARDVFPRPLALDCIPQIGGFGADGYTVEEEKMFLETRKILGRPTLEVSATCVRVPVLRGHLESVTVDLGRPVRAAEAKALFGQIPGLIVAESDGEYATARDCVGRVETFVGRIREDNCRDTSLHFWVVSDNLLKGAAWNAVQIADELHRRGLIRVPADAVTSEAE